MNTLIDFKLTDSDRYNICHSLNRALRIGNSADYITFEIELEDVLRKKLIKGQSSLECSGIALNAIEEIRISFRFEAFQFGSVFSKLRCKADMVYRKGTWHLQAVSFSNRFTLTRNLLTFEILKNKKPFARLQTIGNWRFISRLDFEAAKSLFPEMLFRLYRLDDVSDAAAKIEWLIERVGGYETFNVMTRDCGPAECYNFDEFSDKVEFKLRFC